MNLRLAALIVALAVVMVAVISIPLSIAVNRDLNERFGTVQPAQTP